MKYGLSDATIEKICSVLTRHAEVEKAVLYGTALTSNECASIADELDDLLLPYSIDLSIFDEISNANLREHIERVGVVFYDRTD